jgi:hypothetical protein
VAEIDVRLRRRRGQCDPAPRGGNRGVRVPGAKPLRTSSRSNSSGRVKALAGAI